jgi:putative thioredoxin
MPTAPVAFDVAPGRFDELVLAASRERAIVVDFWAEWCAPCRALGPVLQDVVASYAGRARLARVDIDQHKDVAVRYGIQGIPAVKIFYRGSVVGEFMGALPRPEVERILAAVIPSVADELVARAEELLGTRDSAAAEGLLRQALAEDATHAGALLRLGTVCVDRGHPDEARGLLSRIQENSPEHEAALALLASLEFANVCRDSGGLEDCRHRVQETPDDLDARYDLACCLAADAQYDRALEEFLGILQLDRDYRERAPQQAMLRIFTLVGPRSDLANAYRRKLAATLY